MYHKVISIFGLFYPTWQTSSPLLSPSSSLSSTAPTIDPPCSSTITLVINSNKMLKVTSPDASSSSSSVLILVVLRIHPRTCGGSGDLLVIHILPAVLAAVSKLHTNIQIVLVLWKTHWDDDSTESINMKDKGFADSSSSVAGAMLPLPQPFLLSRPLLAPPLDVCFQFREEASLWRGVTGGGSVSEILRSGRQKQRSEVIIMLCSG